MNNRIDYQDLDCIKTQIEKESAVVNYRWV